MAQSSTLKCYYGDSAHGINTIDTGGVEGSVCARYDFACTPGSVDLFCKEVNPPNVTTYTMYLVLSSSSCNNMPFQNPVCCTTDLCNGGETPTPEIQPPTAVSPPVTEPWPEAPKPEQNTPSPVTPTKADVDNDKTTLFIIAGAVGVFVMLGLIVYGVFSRRKRNATGRNATIEEAENLISGDDLENGDEIRGHGSGSIVRSVTRKGTKYALKKSYNADTYEEYKILAKLDHPNILKVYEFAAKSDSKAGLLTELCDGTLEDRLANLKSPLTDGEVYDYILQLAKAVTYLHELKSINIGHEELQLVLHCDIKPQNVLLQIKDSKAVLKLADFGMAKLIDSVDDSIFDRSNKVVHSNIWTAPEVVKEKKYSISSDLYSFGVVCGQILLRNIRFIDKQDFKEEIMLVKRDVRSSTKNKLIAEFCLDVIDTEKRPTGGNAKTKLLNFIENLDTMCKMDKNEHPEQNPQIIQPGK